MCSELAHFPLNQKSDYIKGAICCLWSRLKIVPYDPQASESELSNDRSESSKTVQMFIYISKIVHEIHKQMNQTLGKSIYGRSHMQTETPRFLL